MSLAIVVVILIGWGIYGIKQALTPPAPPIDDMKAHMQQIMQLNTPAERRKFIKADAKRRRNNYRF